MLPLLLPQLMVSLSLLFPLLKQKVYIVQIRAIPVDLNELE
jgi:hypothetical protein